MTRSGHCRTLLRARIIFVYGGCAVATARFKQPCSFGCYFVCPFFRVPYYSIQERRDARTAGRQKRMTHTQKRVYTSFKALPGNERDEFLGHLMVDAFNLEDDISQAFLEQGVSEDDLQEELLPEILREFVSEFDSTEPMYTQIQNATKYIAERYYTEQEGRRLEAEEARWSEW